MFLQRQQRYGIEQYTKFAYKIMAFLRIIQINLLFCAGIRHFRCLGARFSVRSWYDMVSVGVALSYGYPTVIYRLSYGLCC